MKKYLSLILALCLPALLGGCGAVPLPMPESPTPPPAADTEEITYEVSTAPYEQTVTAEDGTTLMVIDFQIPHLQAYANGALIEDPSSPAQEQAMDRVHTFNENFDQWRESNSSEENVSFVKDLYRDTLPPSSRRIAPCKLCALYTPALPLPCYPLQIGRSSPLGDATFHDFWGPIVRHDLERDTQAQFSIPGILPAIAFPTGSHRPIDRHQVLHRHSTDVLHADTVP